MWPLLEVVNARLDEPWLSQLAPYLEEKRIAFVALSRAKRICVVALPDDGPGREAADTFLARGFRLIDAG